MKLEEIKTRLKIVTNDDDLIDKLEKMLIKLSQEQSRLSSHFILYWLERIYELACSGRFINDLSKVETVQQLHILYQSYLNSLRCQNEN